MNHVLIVALLVILLCSMRVGCAWAAPSEQEQQVSAVLDALHEAASKADGKTYFPLFAEDAVFFGTDRTERMPIARFRIEGQKHFDEGDGWTYRPVERHVFFSEDGKTAWFDERLDNKAGEARGTGVLVLGETGWRIAQYNLSFPVPNELFDGIYAIVRAYEGKK